MGRQTRGIYAQENGWSVDKQFRGHRIFQRGFPSFDEAERWLTAQLSNLREVEIHGGRARRTLDEAAAHYVLTHQHKISIETDVYLLKPVMPYSATLDISEVHDGTLAPFVRARLAEGKSHKTINLSLAIVRRILNLAATSWRDSNGKTWLALAPKITMLPLVGFQREPRPITWTEQAALLPRLPQHLAGMALFTINTGARDEPVCNLRWQWEIALPEIGVSVFVVPKRFVKGRKQDRLIVCNSVAQSVIERQRDKHTEFVFTWRNKPIQTMNNTAWQRARKEIGIDDLHVHDLRHTTGMRLREAGVSENAIAEILWHSVGKITRHYTAAQIVEIHAALEKIKSDSGVWNKSLTTLRREHESRKTHAERKTG